MSLVTKYCDVAAQEEMTGNQRRCNPFAKHVGILFGIVVPTLVGPIEGHGQAQAGWEGAWEWIHESYDGRLLLLDGWFCGVFGAKDRPLPEGDEPNDREAAVLFRTMSGPMCGSLTTASTAEHPIVLENVVTIAARPGNHGARSTRPTRLEGTRMLGDLLRADGSVAVTWIYDRLDQPGTGPLAGAWELDSDTWAGLLLMTDTQYRYVIGLRDRNSFDNSTGDLTDSQAAYLYGSYDAQGGTFSVSGDRMTRVPDIAKDPRIQGHEVVGLFQLDGEGLTTEFGEMTLHWKRVR